MNNDASNNNNNHDNDREGDGKHEPRTIEPERNARWKKIQTSKLSGREG